MNNIKGKVWKFGDYIDTDQIIATQYCILQDKKDMASHALEIANPDFAKQVNLGDVIVGGKNFGCGSSREQAPEVLKTLGVGAIIADSFARIFYRNCINLGLPIIECNGISEEVNQGDVLDVDVNKGIVKKGDETFEGIKLPDFLMEIINDGGLIEHDVKLAV